MDGDDIPGKRDYEKNCDLRENDKTVFSNQLPRSRAAGYELILRLFYPEAELRGI
jgi:hypothetical protein